MDTQTATRPRYEFRVTTVGGTRMTEGMYERLLNKIGGDGWQLVSVAQLDKDKPLYIFQRQI